jgi:prenyl protein peptidase
MLYTIIYVAPFYVSHETRPSPRLFRDSPTVIQGRIVTVTMSCIICSVTTFVLLAAGERRGPLPALHTMGYYPLGLAETAKCLTLTALLFLGPLFEGGVVEGGWRRWVRLRGVGTVLRSWTGYRNYVAVSRPPSSPWKEVADQEQRAQLQRKSCSAPPRCRSFFHRKLQVPP